MLVVRFEFVDHWQQSCNRNTIYVWAIECGSGTALANLTPRLKHNMVGTARLLPTDQQLQNQQQSTAVT